jgi:hypothetical protein
MKVIVLALMATALVAGGAKAAPSVQIRNAAVRVVVVPEARSDVQVTVLKTTDGLPLYISRRGETVFVEGRLPHLFRHCGGQGEKLRISFLTRRYVAKDFPSIVVKTPMDAKVYAGGAALGSVGRARTVELSNSGCGDWTVANTQDVLVVRTSGAGRVQAGSAGSAELTISGSGSMRVGPVTGLVTSRISGSGSLQAASMGEADFNISGSGSQRTGVIARGLRSVISGTGDVDAVSISGPMDVRVSGVGHIRAPRGEVTTLTARISGSGDVNFGGTAQDLEANVSGAGDVYVANVTGDVVKHVSGAGQVRVGSRASDR